MPRAAPRSVSANPSWFARSTAMARATRANETLAARIRHKFRLKNTTGYSLNALVEFEDPVDVLAHLMIGSEGTLGFISEITYVTVPDYANKASALILFDDLETACRAVMLLKSTPVAAVELADRAALRSVEGKPGLPEGIGALGPHWRGAAGRDACRGCGGAVRTDPRDRNGACRDADVPTGALLERSRRVRALVERAQGHVPVRGRDAQDRDHRHHRGRRLSGARLAEATLALQRLLAEHGYADAIIFGHALEGNLHFVFTQDFNVAAEIERYRGFMDALCRMVVERYDGSLKAEHGTGRNIAPFVELEWGAEAYRIMRAIKQLFDPRGLLNPGVIINDDRDAHLKNLKPLPACDPIVDKCIECGFCEPKCPSHKLTLSPRQRIVGWREICRLEHEGKVGAQLETMRELYGFHGIDTCAACGLCATACPVGIEVGVLIKALRGRKASPTAKRIAAVAGDHFGALTGGVRAGLAVSDALHGLVGPDLTAIHAGRNPQPVRRARAQVVACAAAPRSIFNRAVVSTAAVGGTHRVLSQLRHPHHGRATRRRGNRSATPCGGASVRQGRIRGRLSRKARRFVLRSAVREQGAIRGGRSQVGGARGALRDASENGRLPIVFDTSPCTYRMRRHLGGRLQRAGQHRVHPRSRPATGRRRADRFASGHSPGVQRAQDGNRRQVRGDRGALQPRCRARRRGAVLRLCG